VIAYKGSGDIRQELRDNTVNVSTTSESASSDTGKQYRHKRSKRILKNYAVLEK